MKVFIGTDHAGYELKEILKEYIIELGHEVEDVGAFEYEKTDDYPVFIARVARKIQEDPEQYKGIILGGSGQGEAMVANRFIGVRATVYYGFSDDIIELSREHNNANVLSLGARFLIEDEAKRVVRKWLSLEFPGQERHVRRLELMDEEAKNQ